MRKFVILFALLALTCAQKPRPVSKLNLTATEGLWYLVWMYNPNIEHAGLGVSCTTLNITTTTSGGTIAGQFVDNNENNNLIQFDMDFHIVNTGNSVWDIDYSDLAWIASDPINFSWATIASMTEENAIIISRSPNVSDIVTLSNAALLRAQGYHVGPLSVYTVNQTNCPSAEY